jgi:hypothetical protein
MKKLFLILLSIALVAASAYAVTIQVTGNGSRTASVAANEKVAVFTEGSAKVYYKVGAPNIPGRYRLLTTVTNKEYESSAFSSATTVRVDADSRGAWLNVDVTPDVQWGGPTVKMKSQAAPTAKTVAVTLTIEELMGGIITVDQTTGATIALTLPLGTDMDGTSDSISLGVNQSFDWVVINLSDDESADTATITANTGHTLVGSGVVNAKFKESGSTEPGATACFRSRKTAANTYVTYRTCN